MEFRDDISAFDGRKTEVMEGKGKFNNLFNAGMMKYLAENGIPTQHLSLLSDDESLVKRLDMFPIECVIRYRAAGSICKRLGFVRGQDLNPPVFEFFLKNDDLHDPMINKDHIMALNLPGAAFTSELSAKTALVGGLLKAKYRDAGLTLVDFKLEWGRSFEGQITLGDEFTPDSCRVWNAAGEPLDKDRFRQDMGNVLGGYREMAKALGIDVG